MTILQILDELASDNSRLFKEKVLAREFKNPLLASVFFHTLNPNINYWIRKIPAVSSNSGAQTLANGLQSLKPIINREVTGSAAIAHLTSILESLSKDDAEVLSRIIKSDLRCGVNTSTVNKTWKDLIPEYPYMRCSLLKGIKISKWAWAKGVFSQLKADGSFANFTLSAAGDVTITTRAGSVYPLESFTDLVADAQKEFKRDTVTHGELLISKAGVVLPREASNGKLNSLQHGGSLEADEKVVFLVWDQIPLANSVPGGSYKVGYKTRYEALLKQLKNCKFAEMIETKIVYSFEEAMAHYNDLVDQGLEGTIIKTADGEWADGTSKDQVKLKVEVDIDLEIEGFNAGNGKNAKTFGSIRCKSSDGLFRVNVSGYKDKERDEINAKRDELIGTIMTVKINNIMKPTASKAYHSAFLPRKVEFRDDKTVADDLQKIIDQFDSVVKKAVK